MASANKYDTFQQALGRGLHNLHADALKIALTNRAPDASNDVALANVSEIAASGGYSSGGAAVANTTFVGTSGVGQLLGDDVLFTATGTFGPFRYAVLYNSTPAGGLLIAWWDYGSNLTLANGDTFTVDWAGNRLILSLT